MDFNEYQKKAVTTAIYHQAHKVTYPALGLGNEAGEVLGKVKKVLRDNDGLFTDDQVSKIADEVGDVLWYMAALCRDLNVNLEDVAQKNIDKLEDRKNRNVIKGSGDSR